VLECALALLACCLTGGGMASKGVRAISYQVTQKVEAGYCASHTDETLIGYTACWVQCVSLCLVVI